jgi:carboxylesterase
MNKREKFVAPRGSVYFPGGPTGILLFHSLGGSPLELKLVAQSFARQGYTVYCPVIAGLTYGTDVSSMSTWRDWYDAADRAFDQLKSVCRNIVVGGSSAGGTIALRLASYRQSETEAMLLYAPTLSVNGWAIPFSLKFFHLITDKATARLFKFRSPSPYGIKDERVRKFAVDSFRGEDGTQIDITRRNGGSVFEFFRLVRNVRSLLSSVKLPTLIFHPRHDDQSDLRTRWSCSAILLESSKSACSTTAIIS